VLIITADDYGYAPSYDAGILEAARAGALDALGAMVLRDPDPTPLRDAVVEVGLHLERLDERPVAEQAASFERLFGGPPAYLDGHHHCHAEPDVAAEVAEVAAALGTPVRAVSATHRRLLRAAGVACADRIVGRLSEAEPAMPAELTAWLERGSDPPGVSEWMVHPGHPDPGVGSRYDSGRAEDLRLLLELGDRDAWAARGIVRAGPRAALTGRAGR
jgi:chitin disaccharide deacetylase